MYSDNKLKPYIKKLQSDLEKEKLSAEEENALWLKIKAENNRNRKAKRLRLLLFSSAIAASIALLLVWAWRKPVTTVEDQIDYAALLTPNTTAESQSQNVQLLLSDNKKLTISDKESNIDYRQAGEVKVNEETLDIENEEIRSSLNKLIVPAGKRASLILSDGTRMWVNSGSQVIYPAQFGGAKREIYLEGEIYLNVKTDKDVPFIVKTQDLDIAVLGTQFNISTVESQQSSEVVLVSGKVEVTTKNRDKSVLSPNELFTYNSATGNGSIKKVNVADYVAWKYGYYQFNKLYMDKVLQKIARYYGIQIEWDEKVTRLSCSGKLDLKDNPDDVLDLLKKAAPVYIEKTGGKYLVKVKP